jgi:hypothetical protein
MTRRDLDLMDVAGESIAALMIWALETTARLTRAGRRVRAWLSADRVVCEWVNETGDDE